MATFSMAAPVFELQASCILMPHVAFILMQDSQEVPFLLSRKHCKMQFQTDGKITLTDNNSTNGTYTARMDNPLRRVNESCHDRLQIPQTLLSLHGST